MGQVALKLGGSIINSHEIIGTDSCTAAEVQQVCVTLLSFGM